MKAHSGWRANNCGAPHECGPCGHQYTHCFTLPASLRRNKHGPVARQHRLRDRELWRACTSHCASTTTFLEVTTGRGPRNNGSIGIVFRLGRGERRGASQHVGDIMMKEAGLKVNVGGDARMPLMETSGA